MEWDQPFDLDTDATAWKHRTKHVEVRTEGHLPPVNQWMGGPCGKDDARAVAERSGPLDDFVRQVLVDGRVGRCDPGFQTCVFGC
jgi:hypothetical protein